MSTRTGKPMTPNEVILKVGAEGGSVTLYGIRADDGWRFSRKLIDQTPALIDEPAIEHASTVVRTWPEALELMDQYPWPQLMPLEVHPDFRGAVFEAVMKRVETGKRISDWPMDDWKELCGIG